MKDRAVGSTPGAGLVGLDEVLGVKVKSVPCPARWEDLSLEQRRKWRSWFDAAVRAGGRFWDEDRQRISLAGVYLEAVDLAGVDLRGADLSNATLCGSRFDGANLSDVSFTDSNLSDCSFSSADLRGADLRWSVLDRVCFRRAVLGEGSKLSRASGVKVEFTKANLEGTYFSGAELPEAIFTRALLRGAQLPGSRLDGSTFISAEADGVNLERASFRECRFTDSQLRGARFSGGSGRSAVFKRGDLRAAKFSACDLKSAEFVGSRLDDVSFDDADLAEARFVSVDLTRAGLSEAILQGTSVDRCKWIEEPVRVSVLGAPLLPAGLPWHPAHEIRGLSRRELRRIADGQFIRDSWRQAKVSWLSQVMFRAWGLTSAYGHSVARWLVCCVGVVMLFAFLICFVSTGTLSRGGASPEDTVSADKTESNTGEREEDRRSGAVCSIEALLGAVYESTLVFLSLGGVLAGREGHFLKIVLLLEVLCGYLMLGVLVSILAVRLVSRE